MKGLQPQGSYILQACLNRAWLVELDRVFTKETSYKAASLESDFIIMRCTEAGQELSRRCIRLLAGNNDPYATPLFSCWQQLHHAGSSTINPANEHP